MTSWWQRQPFDPDGSSLSALAGAEVLRVGAAAAEVASGRAGRLWLQGREMMAGDGLRAGNTVIISAVVL